jgi:hypothetical protein
MKKLLILFLMSLSNLVYGQDYKTLNVSTTVRTTSIMSWNSNEGSWDFIDNNDLESFNVEWRFVLNAYQNSGTITGNNVSYDVTSIQKKISSDNQSMIVIKATSTRALNEVTFILTETQAGTLLIGVYDFKARKSYYYN